jgi:sec-independent protein translocase protein TatA
MGIDNPIHIAFLLIVLLLVFGARRLPEMGRSLGSGMRGFKDALSGEDAESSRGAELSPGPRPSLGVQPPLGVQWPPATRPDAVEADPGVATTGRELQSASEPAGEKLIA